MAQTDAEVGRILRALEQNGFAENTLVIFSADNGAEYFAYERLRRFQHRSSGPLRGAKRDLYEGGHRVPFVVKWPGEVKPGSVSDGLISQMAGVFAMRHEDWLLIAHKTGAHSKVPAWFDSQHGYVEDEHPGEIYNLRTDLAQKHNLYAAETAKVQELTTLLNSFRAKGQVR